MSENSKITPKIDRETFVDAIRETAFAYYNKGPLVQYDGRPWTIRGGLEFSGAKRPTAGTAPEEGSTDHWLYSVCSDFVYTVYKTAFGYDLMGMPQRSITKLMTAMPSSDPLVAFKYDPSGNDPGAYTELEAALKAARQTLQTGDVIVSYGTVSGHAMLCIGDYKNDGHCYIAHCWGKSFIEDTGEDHLELAIKNANPRGGAIRVDDVDGGLFVAPGESGVWNLRDEKRSAVGIVILRPYQTAEFAAIPLPAATAARLRLRGIEICKETSVNRYGAVLTGTPLRMTVTVSNHGVEPYTDLVISEPLPTGATLCDAGGGTVEGDRIVWKVDVKARAIVSVSCAFLVTAKRGERVTFAHGDVGGLRTRATAIPVGGRKLPAPDCARLLAQQTRPQSPAAFAGDAYRALFGVALDLPTDLNACVEALCDRTPVLGADAQYGGWMWKPKTAVAAEWQRLRDMILPEHLAGRAMFLEGDPQAIRKTWMAVDRVQEYRAERYEPGDIFLALAAPDMQVVTDPANVLCYVYLGSGTVARYDAEKGVVLSPFDETVGRLLNKSIAIGLRPTLAHDDLAAERPAE